LRKYILPFAITALITGCTPHQTNVIIEKDLSAEAGYAASILKSNAFPKGYNINLLESKNINELPAEGFNITRKKHHIYITGNDKSGIIYGANRLIEYYKINNNLDIPSTIIDAPEMKLRGACIGLQKTEYLPGHKVYEYPYTPENFPWFYNKALWIKYLDMLASNNMNAVFLWNGHPFASLVKLKDYPFAQEVDDATMKLNEEMFMFITKEAARRGIKVIQMFYNIIVSKPFADHYHISTQDRNRPITPLISDYTRKSIAAFIEKYPNVGFLVCLGEAMATIDDDVEWMTKTIIPGIKDGLTASGRTDLPPIILRSHDTDGPRVLKVALPLYKNIYTMTKYTGESLTTYEPGGPWGETQKELSNISPLHISNVHILANLEPWRWSSPAFTEKAVQAMHNVHGANGLHLYPQASYWDWPYSADKLANGKRELQIDRDWMWYAAWARYAWNCHRGSDESYWTRCLADYYGTDTVTASKILTAYDESGEIAPKLIRRFGITEGNRQTLLLGMKISQLVNPYKYTIYPGFYESCGPSGEKLIEYVKKEWIHQSHIGELPLDIVNQCKTHGDKAVNAIDDAAKKITKNCDEFIRLKNDIHCYSEFAQSFRYKVLAAEQILNYKWSHNINYLNKAVPLLEQSDKAYNRLVSLTKDTYLYANSMQTSQRRIPIGGDNGNYKTWEEMLPVYEEELNCLKTHIRQLNSPQKRIFLQKENLSANQADIKLISDYKTVKLCKGAHLFEDRNETVDSIAAELSNLKAIVFNRDSLRINGATIDFETNKPVTMLVGFFIDDQNKFATAPKLEVDASANDYGQAEPLIRNAIRINGMPMVNIHAYHFLSGRHYISLPKGIIMIAGFTNTELNPRDAGLNGGAEEVDWLFYR
jgi:hypothetical protein